MQIHSISGSDSKNEVGDVFDERDREHFPFLVTNLKSGIKDENRVNVFLNGKFEFSLEISQVVDLGVKVGKKLTAEDVANLRNASEFGKLYTNTLEWLLARPRSVRETRDHLKKKKYNREIENRCRAENREYKKAHPEENPYKNPDNLDENGNLKFKNSRWAQKTTELPEITDENIEAVVRRLEEKGYLDDEKFAKFYVENRFVKKGISERRLRQELQKKGVSKHDIEMAFYAVPRNDTEEIKKIIAKKRKKYDDFRLVNYLVRQGFDYQLAQSLVHEKD